MKILKSFGHVVVVEECAPNGSLAMRVKELAAIGEAAALEQIPMIRQLLTRLDSQLFSTCCQFVAQHDPDAVVLPTICAGFTDSHYARESFGSGAKKTRTVASPAATGFDVPITFPWASSAPEGPSQW